MADTQPLAPTDAEIDAFVAAYLGDCGPQATRVYSLTRAVPAKWGAQTTKAQTIQGVQWQCGPQASGFTAPQADSQPVVAPVPDWLPFSKRKQIADRHGVKVTAEFNALVHDVIQTYLETHAPR